MGTQTDSKQMNILVADDHKIVTQLLQSYLLETDKFNNIVTANSSIEVIKCITEQDFQIVLLDIMMPDQNGLKLANEILSINPKIKVIILTSLLNKEVIMDAFKIGAKGYINKTANIKEIIDAIELVIKGDKYFCHDCMKAIIDDSITGNNGNSNNNGRSKQDYEIPELSKREKQILRMIIEEWSMTDIADKLNVSARTIETHKRNIMSKLGAKTTIGLIKIVFERNLQI